MCTRSTLAVADGAQQITVTGTFAAGTGAQTAANVATAASQTADPDQANNGASVTQGITPSADLVVSKTAVQTDGVTPLTTALAPGGAFDYFLTVINNGPSDASGVVVTDPLPSGIVADTTRPFPAGCTSAANTFTCTIATVTAGASTSIALPVMATNPNLGGVASNLATVSSATADPDPTTNAAGAIVGVTPVADLQLTKSQSLQTATVGDTATFTLTATNLGPSATGGVITDPLPTGLSFGSSSDCTFSAPNVTCDVGGLAVGASRTVSFTATVTSAAAGSTIANTATIASRSAGAGFAQLGDFDPFNNVGSSAQPVNPQADLSLTKSVSAPTAQVGDLVNYTLTASNGGPNPATGVTIADPIPSGLGFVDASNGCTNVSGTLTCKIGDLPSGGSVSVTLSAWVLNGAAGTSRVNRATVAGDQPDPNAANNQASATTNIPIPPTRPQAPKLKITKTVNHKRASFGAKLKYTITISNAGPGIAVTPTITDKLSGAVSIVSIHTSSGSCHRRKPLTCQLATIEPGQRVKITLLVRARALGKLRNTVRLSTPTPLAAGSRVLATATSTITPGPHTRLVLHDRTNTPQIPAGGTATFRPTVTNPNPFRLHKVKVCDRLPAGTKFVLASGSPRHAGRLVCWTIATLRPHGSKSFWVKAEPLLGVTGVLSDAATATATAAGRRLTAQAKANVSVGNGRCGSASDLAPLSAFTNPVSAFTNPLSPFANPLSAFTSPIATIAC